MQWLAFLITAILTVTVQTTLAPALTVGGVRPDFILIAVIFFALHGRGLDAVIAGWALGFAADLQSVQRFGLMALCYALVAYGVYAIRPYLFRRHPLAHFLVTFVSGLLVYGLLLLWTLIVLFPLYWLVITSFKTALVVNTGPYFIPWLTLNPVCMHCADCLV